MKDSAQPSTSELERRELQISILACIAVSVLAIGTALLMYPVVFSQQDQPAYRNLRAAFLGFCVLSVLLTAYLWNQQMTIRRLRHRITGTRERMAESQRQASEALLSTMADFRSFQDRLPMEHRRAMTVSEPLSVLIVAVRVPGESTPSILTAAVGDAAKAIARKLRKQDSMYLLGASAFAVILPGVNPAVAQKIAARVGEGLSDAAGAANRFACKLHSVSYPENAATSRELEQAVRAHIPRDNSADETDTSELAIHQ
jgi:GGDEF domain-containing protein